MDHIIDLMNQDPTRPVIICEYAHAMGNSLGNFRKYWDAFDTYPRLQGGFIWDWVDQALRRPGPGGTVIWNWVNTCDGALPPLPRVGFQAQLPGRVDTAEWYGRGPHESDADRKEGARLGIHRAKVADLHFPYVMAQENLFRFRIRPIQ